MVETKTQLQATHRVLWNTNALSVALLILISGGCGDDPNPSGMEPQNEAGRGGSSMPAAGKGAKPSGTGGTAGTPPSAAGSGGNTARAGSGGGGSGGKPAADGGKDGNAEAGSGGSPAAGSGGSAGDESPVEEATEPSELAAALASAICDALEQCVGPQKLAALNLREDCTERFTASLTQDDFGSLEASIEAGTVKLDPSQLETCYSDTRKLGCKVQTERLPDSCARAIAGQQDVGESCSIGSDCRNGAFCPIDAECPRTCQATRDEGAECTRDSECQPGTICSGGVCVAPGLRGQACAGNSGASCAFGLSCVNSTDTQAGTCETNANVQAGERGDGCTPGNTLCKEGLSCAHDSGATFRCVAPAAEGKPCKLSLPSQCPIDTYCDVPNNDVTLAGTCRALPADGEACVLGDDCAPGHVCVTQDDTGVCKKIGDIGDACEADALCRSGSCQDGSCALRPRCE